MVLRELTISDSTDVYEMLQRIGPAENEFHNDVNGMTFAEYKMWLKKQHSWANGDELPTGYVKQWTYWLYKDGVPVGYGKLRERVTEESKKFGGNIGFAIDPLYRGRGYGNMFFHLLLNKARDLGIKEIFSTVEKYNYASKTIHENCKGLLIKEDENRWYFIFDIN